MNGEPRAPFEARCSALAEELARQAQTPDRCPPYFLSSEVGPYESSLHLFVRPFANRTTQLADHADMSDDHRFRLLVQGMIMGRDLTQGPTGFEQAQRATVETELGAVFAAHFGLPAPSAETREELDQALGILADMPIDANTFLSGEALQSADGFQATAVSGHHMMNDDEMR